MTRMLLLAALALACVVSSALAAEVATVGDKALIVPWGDWLVALAVSLREPILTILIPIIAGYVIQAIRKVYPWATLFLSQRRVEMMLEAAVGFGLNAVQGAAKGKTLSANVAVPVIAKGTQYVIDTAPPAVIKAAGGADGIAARMFRKLDLDDNASDPSARGPRASAAACPGRYRRRAAALHAGPARDDRSDARDARLCSPADRGHRAHCGVCSHHA
jgi:hypothetical protein